MIPEDKFGNTLKWRIYSKLLRWGAAIMRIGYSEANNKPNLFYKRSGKVTHYVDMRGTEIVKLWDDPRPFHYMFHGLDGPRWLVNRLREAERKEIINAGCPLRTTFEEEDDDDDNWFMRYYAATDDEQRVMRLYNGTVEDGYCKECGRDFQDNGHLCPECMPIVVERSLPYCELCKRRIRTKWQDEKPSIETEPEGSHSVRTSGVQFEYALSQDGKPVHISEADKSSFYRCLNSNCSQRMIPHQGKKLAWHFAHKSAVFDHAGESALHYNMKYLLYTLIAERIASGKELCFVGRMCNRCDTITTVGVTNHAQCVKMEASIAERYRPDLSIVYGCGRAKAVIEVVHTHDIDEAALSCIAAEHIVCFRVLASESLYQEIHERRKKGSGAIRLPGQRSIITERSIRLLGGLA